MEIPCLRVAVRITGRTAADLKGAHPEISVHVRAPSCCAVYHDPALDTHTSSIAYYIVLLNMPPLCSM